jgi:hypothetical protein
MNHITEALSDALIMAIERIIATLDGLDRDGLNFKPEASQPTSSVYVLAVHTMANAEMTVLSMLDGQNRPRDRDAEFAAIGESREWVDDRWAELKPQLQDAIAGFTPEHLDKEYEHPRRGKMTGWEALLMAATHANEHVGHAELTRDMLKAR